MMNSRRVVVVIEDDPSMLKGLERLLGTLGFATELFTSAEDYLKQAADIEASCLLLDINLGGISGIELTRRLMKAGASKPVIFMTATASSATETDARAAGCVAYLHKPFQSTALIEALNRATAA
jgi:FixJ family two-component response regulator